MLFQIAKQRFFISKNPLVTFFLRTTHDEALGRNLLKKLTHREGFAKNKHGHFFNNYSIQQYT